MRAPRLVIVGWLFHVKSLTMSLFFLMTAVFQPLLVATIAYYMFRAGGKPGTLFYASLGAAVYGIWSSTLFGSGGAIQWQRWQGTLELLVSAPAPFFLVLLPLTLATSTIGVYSLASTLFWGRVVFGVPFHVDHPVAFVAAIPATILGLGLLGLLFASTFVLYRHANALSNMLEQPVLLVTGMLVPLSLLPGWSHPIAWVLAPTWGIRAMRAAAGLRAESAWPDIGMTLALGLAYLAIGAVFLRHFEAAARKKATLSLT
jgi:ABC-type polysaccharide/polyol phosphate export permease